MLDNYRTPTRRKSTIDDISYTQKRNKCSTADSYLVSQPRLKRQITQWQQSHDYRRQSRLNSMIKLRKEKLEEITQQNQKIFLRLNQQQSHHSHKLITPDRAKNKENENDDGLLGHLREFETPACFIIGERGIMCEQRLGLDNIVLKKGGRMLPQISKTEALEKKQSNKITGLLSILTQGEKIAGYLHDDMKRAVSDSLQLVDVPLILG